MQGFGRAFRLDITAAAGGAVVEEPAEDDEDDVVAAAAAPAPGAGSSRFSTGLFEGQGSFVAYTPDPRLVSYLLSRKRRTDAASQPSVRKRRSLRPTNPTGNILVGELVSCCYPNCFL